MKNRKDPLKFKTTFFLIGLNIALISVFGLFNLKMKMKEVVFASETMGGMYFPIPVLVPKVESEPTIEPENRESDQFIISEEDPFAPNELDKKQAPFANTTNLDSFLKPLTHKPIVLVDVGDEQIHKGIEATFKYGELGPYLQGKIVIPSIAREIGVTGLVMIQFVVEKDGAISNIEVLAPQQRQIGYGVEQACMQAIQVTSGFWTPAEFKNRKVRSYFRIPIEIDCSMNSF